MSRKSLTKVLNAASACLAALIVVVVIASWVVAALSADMTVRSLLSSEGVRWLFASFTTNIASPLLVWLILLAMAYGTVVRSAFGSDFLASRRGRPLSYRQKYAYRIVLILFTFLFVTMLLLTMLPHALLLSVTGHLFPSSFSSSLVPGLSFTVIISAAAYGIVSGRFTGITDVLESFSRGIASAAPFFLPCLLALELFHILAYVLGL